MRRIIPGFGISLGFTITYLSVIVLIPLAALFIKASGLGFADSWKLLTSPHVLAAARLSFGASAAAAATSVFTGLLVAWTLVRYQFPGRRLLDAMVDLPFALPTAVAGITLTTIYGKEGWIGNLLSRFAISYQEAHHLTGWFGELLDGWAEKGAAYSSFGVFLALTFIGFPFVVRTVQPVMEDMANDVEEAAATLGANRWTVFRRVIFPALLPALVTGFTLAFARAVGEYGSVIFISGNLPGKTEILPLMIVAQLEQNHYAAAAMIASTMLVISFALLLIINLLQRRLNWQTR